MAVSVSFAVAPAPSHAVMVIAGVCEMELTLSLTTPATLSAVPVPVSWTVTGGGPCTAHDGDTLYEDAAGSLNGTLASLSTAASANCAAGVLRGELIFDVATDGFDTIETEAIADVGGIPVVLTTVAVDPLARLVGSGAFLQSTDAVTGCAAGISAVTWNGRYAFADPVVP